MLTGFKSIAVLRKTGRTTRPYLKLMARKMKDLGENKRGVLG
jgi:hypothetical protein